jgi:hypothetical protein
MIVPQEPTDEMSKKGKIAYYGVIIVVSALILIAVGNVMVTSFLSINDYWAPGSNTEVQGAPDGTYLQKDWGSPNNISYPHGGGWINNATSWSFAMCNHDYLGPLHGTWDVAKGTQIPLWKDGVFPIDARLYVTIKDNIIVDASVHSQFEYGN